MRKNSVISSRWSVRNRSWLEFRSFVPCQFRWNRTVTLNEHLLEVIKDITVLKSQECCSHTRLSCTTSTPNTVSVRFNIPRHIIVDNMSDIRYVNPTSGNVSGNKNIISLGPKPLKTNLSLLLRLPSMQSGHAIPFLIQILGNHIRILFGVDKHDRSLVVKLVKQSLKLVKFLRLLHHDHMLADQISCLSSSTDGDHNRVPQILPSKPLHSRGHGGAEHISGPVNLLLVKLLIFILRFEIARRHGIKDTHHLGLKPHVNHTISLVKNNIIALV
ncbi:hypothetical protein V8G54_015825 [Vigna mungo]|uniref:Uncharacterized protein n=1 Tax=Vigna mungo TaxID=3915 RepID=A0AAQ3NJ64_VIGMU